MEISWDYYEISVIQNFLITPLFDTCFQQVFNLYFESELKNYCYIDKVKKFQIDIRNSPTFYIICYSNPQRLNIANVFTRIQKRKLKNNTINIKTF